MIRVQFPASDSKAHDLAYASDERWLLAARSFSVVVLTAFARRACPYFGVPPDPMQRTTWQELRYGVGAFDKLVVACNWMNDALHAPLQDLRKVCSATHFAAWNEWPTHDVHGFHARCALTPDDRSLAESIARAALLAPVLSGEALLWRAQEVLATELAESGVCWMPIGADEEDGEIVAAALTDLLAAEWTLWAAGRELAAERVGLARSVVGTAVAGLWSRSATIPDRSARAASAVLQLLQHGE